MPGGTALDDVPGALSAGGLSRLSALDGTTSVPIRYGLAYRLSEQSSVAISIGRVPRGFPSDVYIKGLDLLDFPNI